MKNIKEIKKELWLTDTDIAGYFGLSLASYSSSSAKKRYETALCRFYERINPVVFALSKEKAEVLGEVIKEFIKERYPELELPEKQILPYSI